MEKIMTNPGLFSIRDNIFGHLTYEDLEICCKVSDSWNESLNKNSSLKRKSLVKYLLEFGGNFMKIEYKWKKVLEVIPGWNKGVKKVGSQASLDDLKEIKELILEHYNTFAYNYYENNSYENPVFWAARKGHLTLMKLFLETSFDMNTRVPYSSGSTIFLEAVAFSGSSEMVQLIIRSSKENGIDLNLRDVYGQSAWSHACEFSRLLEIPKLIFENYKEFGIDIMHEDEEGYTALDRLKWLLEKNSWATITDGVEEWEEFISILEEEYAKIDSLEPAA